MRQRKADPEGGHGSEASRKERVRQLRREPLGGASGEWHAEQDSSEQWLIGGLLVALLHEAPHSGASAQWAKAAATTATPRCDHDADVATRSPKSAVPDVPECAWKKISGAAVESPSWG
eukprot:Skav204218  [mRNA]  locus=scaffold1606:238065:241331:- [translate_table: standard]